MKLQIGFNRRFDSNFRRVQQAVSSGEIGQPCLMHIISRDPRAAVDFLSPHFGREFFLDMMIHDFDMARYLIGDEVEEIYTTAGVLAEPGDRRGRRSGYGDRGS